MAAIIAGREVGIRATGKTVQVPGSAKGRLMYYLNCIFQLIGDDDLDADLRRLARYENWRSLSLTETHILLKICTDISPDMLEDKLFFQSDRMCGSSTNEFYSIEQASTFMAVASSVLIAGKQRQVAEIMTYKNAWIQKNYWQALRELREELAPRRIQSAPARRSSSNDDCIIL
eukprot:scpid95861/ scgid24788/ 